MLGPWSTHSPLMFCVELVPGQPTSALARPAYQGADLTPPAVVATKPIARRHVVLAAIVLSHCGPPAKARAPRPGTARGLSRRKPSQTSPAPPSRDGQRVRGPEHGQEHDSDDGVHFASSDSLSGASEKSRNTHLPGTNCSVAPGFVQDNVRFPLGVHFDHVRLSAPWMAAKAILACPFSKCCTETTLNFA